MTITIQVSHMHRTIRLAALCSGWLFSHAAAADVSYDATANISYTINSLTNTDPARPDDLSGLTISGSEQELTDTSDFYAATSGDASYTSDHPAIAAVPVTTGSFGGSYTVSGDSALSGTIDALQTVQFSLDFTATGSDSYNIDVSLGYLLNALAAGQAASSIVMLDYWDSAGNLSGFDYVQAATYAGLDSDNESQPGSAALQLTLAAGTTDSFIVQAAIQSALDSTAGTAVPLPPAAWLFAAGLAGLRLTRQRQSHG